MKGGGALHGERREHGDSRPSEMRMGGGEQDVGGADRGGILDGKQLTRAIGDSENAGDLFELCRRVPIDGC